MPPISSRLSAVQRRMIKRIREIVNDPTILRKSLPKDWFFFLYRNRETAADAVKFHSNTPNRPSNLNSPDPPKESSSQSPNVPLKTQVDKKLDSKKLSETTLIYRYGLDIPKFLDDIRHRLSSSKVPEKPIPKWKTKPVKVTREAISNRTQHLLSQIVAANEIPVRYKRIEEFFNYLMKYHYAKHVAVKQGAIRRLLYVRKTVTDEATLQVNQQVLTVLGYVDPPKSTGIRILSIDGGGMRGIAVIQMLKYLEKISGKSVLDLFDFICGVSTGAIITCCLVPPNSMTLDQVHHLYQNLSSEVFNQSAFWGTSKLFWSHAYYDTKLWEQLLKNYVGDTKLIETAKFIRCPKIACVSTIVNHAKVTPYIFRNYASPCSRNSDYHGSLNHSMFEAVRASAAAPTIFEECRIDGILHQDGGMIVNNPTAVAIHEAKTLWPFEEISCVVSCGTGRYNPVATLEDIQELCKDSLTWKQIFDKILASATDTEGVHSLLNDILPEGVYFRLNPHLSRTVTMDEVNKETISILEEDTAMYCRRNRDKFSDVATKLMVPRSKIQNCLDYTNERAKIFGVI